MSGDEEKPSPGQRIETEGGAYFEGNVDSGGGDIIGRDRVVHGDDVRGDKITQLVAGIPPWTLFLLAALIVGGMILAARVRRGPLGHPPTPTATPTAFSSATQGEALVIVTQFDDRSQGQKAGTDYAQRIYQRLRRDTERRSLRIRVELYPDPVDQTGAVEVGRAYSATLVLWGWYDAFTVTPIAEIIKAGDTESFLGDELDISTDDRFRMCIVGELPEHSSFLSLFTLGMALFRTPEGEDSDETLDLFTAAIELAPQESECRVQAGSHQAVSLSWAYYYRGGVHYYRRMFEQALEDVLQAVALDPDYYIAYRGLRTIYSAMDDLDSALEVCTDGIGRAKTAKDQAVLYAARAQTHTDRENYDLALSDLEKAIDLDPKYPKAYAYRCRVYHLMERSKAALDDCKEALTLDPKFTWAYNVRGNIYHKMGLYDQALADYERAIENDATYGWPHQNRGVVLAKLGRSEEAIPSFGRAISLQSDPKNRADAYANRCRAYREIGDLDRALADCNRALDLDGAYTWAYDERGRVFLAQGKTGEALADFDRAIRLDPSYGWTYVYRGQVFLELREWHQAREQFGKAIERLSEPDDLSVAYANRCKAWRLGREPGKALEDCNRAIDLDAGFGWALNERGIVHDMMGDGDQALLDYQRAADLDPDYAWPYRNEGELLIKMGRSSEAVEPLSQAIELFTDPDELARAYDSRCRAYRLQREFRSAYEDCSQAVEVKRTPMGYNNRGFVIYEWGKPRWAIADYSRAIELDADYVTAYLNRAESHTKLGQYGLALEDYARALEIEPQNEHAARQRGLVYRKMGRRDEAIAIWQDYIERGGDPAGRDEVEAWLAELERNPLAGTPVYEFVAWLPLWGWSVVVGMLVVLLALGGWFVWIKRRARTAV